MTGVTVPISTFILLLMFAMYGLFVSAIMLSVAVTSIVQRKTMHAEVRRYTTLLERANENLGLLNERKAREELKIMYVDGADLHIGRTPVKTD